MDNHETATVPGAAWAELGPAQTSSCAKPQPLPSPETLVVVADLGLAFPPRSAVDEADHAARIALLAEDCADLPVEHLRAAAAEWRRTKPFLPKACELREETLARARLAMRGRMIGKPRDDSRPLKAPPLTEAEIARTPPHILKIGLAMGDITQDQFDRATSMKGEG